MQEPQLLKDILEQIDNQNLLNNIEGIEDQPLIDGLYQEDMDFSLIPDNTSALQLLNSADLQDSMEESKSNDYEFSGAKLSNEKSNMKPTLTDPVFIGELSQIQEDDDEQNETLIDSQDKYGRKRKNKDTVGLNFSKEPDIMRVKKPKAGGSAKKAVPQVL